MKKLILFVMVFGIMFAGLSITDVSVSPDPITPGGYGTITATISSTLTTSSTGTVLSGGDDVKNVEIELFSYGGLEEIQDNIILGDLDAGASTLVSIPIKVRDDAESGNYLFKIKAIGWAQSGGSSQITDKSATLVINVINYPTLTIQIEKSVIGEKEEIELILINDGGTAKELRITVSGGFAIEGKDQIYVGDVEDQKTISFILDSSDADAGTNDVEFTLDYYDELGNEMSETKTLRLNVVKEESIITITQESEVISNINDELLLKIKNTGGKNIEDVKISFPNEDLKLTDFEKINIGDMSSGEEIEMNIAVFADLNPGLNQVETQIEWKEGGEEKSDIVKLPITVSSDVAIGIYLEAKPSPLYYGQEHTLTVLVSNLGSYTINNVEVKIEPETLTLLDIQPSEYIGELSSDDFSTVQFKIRPNQVGSQEVNIEVKYKDQSGEWKTENITKEIIVYEMEQDYSGLFSLLVILAIIAVVVWYFKLRKK